MRSDKKVAGGKIRFVVPAEKGRSVITGDVPPPAVRQVLREVLFVKR
jgi:3-dehydroquinate synthetase